MAKSIYFQLQSNILKKKKSLPREGTKIEMPDNIKTSLEFFSLFVISWLWFLFILWKMYVGFALGV